MPLIYYVSDSQSSFYKYAMELGRYLTGNDAEYAHQLGVQLASHALTPVDRVGNPPSLATKVWGIPFPNPLGLAAGFDKNADCMPAMLCNGGIGFGFVEIGSVTPQPQPGNPKPRVFRLSRDLAIINRYGFNSDGEAVVAKRLAAFRCGTAARGLVGVNLGMNKESTSAVDDYVVGIRSLMRYADYMVINVSSPNTAGLRSLQGKQQLHALLSGVKKEMQSVIHNPLYVSQSSSGVTTFVPPLLVKISPDMSDSEMADVAAVAMQLEIDGIIVSNTTIGQRDTLIEREWANEPGGLSGKPLLTKANAALAKMYKLTKGKIPLIGVGGVSSAEDAYEKIKLGASLVQLYSALVYEGPGLPASIKRDLALLVKKDGYVSIEEAVGAAHRPGKR